MLLTVHVPELEKKADSLIDQLQPEVSSDWIELPPDSQETRASASWDIGLELPGGGGLLRIRPNYAFSRITSAGLAGP